MSASSSFDNDDIALLISDVREESRSDREAEVALEVLLLLLSYRTERRAFSAGVRSSWVRWCSASFLERDALSLVIVEFALSTSRLMRCCFEDGVVDVDGDQNKQ